MPTFSHPGDGLILDMDRHLKERLVGATVLVLIAVLFVPELLSGPPRPRAAPPLAEVSEVPTGTTAIVRTYTVDLAHPGLDRPASEAALPEAEVPPGPQTPLPAAALAQSAPAGSDAAVRAADATTTPSSVPSKEPRAEAAFATRTEPRSDSAPRIDAAAREEAPPARAAAEKPHAADIRTPAPAAAAKSANSFAPIGEKGGWSIQLGSFASKANAEKLARGLRSKGIRVYVSQAAGKHRVRAGPFADRASADRMAGRLRAQGQSVSIIAP